MNCTASEVALEKRRSGKASANEEPAVYVDGSKGMQPAAR
jgi:hypothetical protein